MPIILADRQTRLAAGIALGLMLALAGCGRPAGVALTPEVKAAVAAALEVEAKARAIAKTAPEQYAVADDIYEGPAVMAIWRGESAGGPYQGLGVLELPDSGVSYAGRFKDGLLDGPGVHRDVEERLIFAGTFKAGDREGPGAAYGGDGQVSAAGVWAQNSLGY